jgi:hypothetical protein
VNLREESASPFDSHHSGWLRFRELKPVFSAAPELFELAYSFGPKMSSASSPQSLATKGAGTAVQFAVVRWCCPVPMLLLGPVLLAVALIE